MKLTVELFFFLLLFVYCKDDAYIATFFMTYRSFATPTIVLDLIIRRYKGPENLNLEEAEKWDVFVYFFEHYLFLFYLY